MGCDYSKRPKAEPEDILRFYESMSGFSSLSLSDIDYAAIKYAPGTVLTEGQLRKIVEKLSLPQDSVRLTEFFDSLKNGEVYDREAFFVAAYMLAKGRKSEKCEYLLKLVVPLGHDMISRGQAELLFHLMCKVSLQHTPYFTPSVELSSSQVAEYLSRLQTRSDSLTARLLTLTLADQPTVQAADFAAVLTEKAEGALTPSGVRKMAIDCEETPGTAVEPILNSTLPASSVRKPVKKLRFSERVEMGNGGVVVTEGQGQTGTQKRSILKRLTIA